MSDAMSWYEKLQKAELENNKERIKQVLKAGQFELQTVLALKTCCKALEDEEHFTFHGEKNNQEVFGFSEQLVNRLMHLAYLYGSRDIEQSSFSRGYYACKKDLAKSLNALADEFCLWEEDK